MAPWPWVCLNDGLYLDLSDLIYLQRCLEVIAARQGIQVPPSYSDAERIECANKMVTR